MKKIILTTLALTSSLTFFAQNTFPTSGNVGIGTTSPKTGLDVNGHVILDEVTSEHTYLRIGHDIHDRIFSDNSKNKFYGGGMFFRVTTDPKLTTRTSLDVMMLTDEGKVGIGTRLPDSELTVKGKVHCEEVQVDLQVPADYVFEKYYTGVSELKAEYTMPTLAEIETYTKENHHLPNIPSATEIKEEGLHLKQMTNLLLQKVEELTLYTIEQEKRINTLEAKLVAKK